MPSIYSRQSGLDNNDDGFIDDGGDRVTSFWWTNTGEIVRWSVFFGIFFLIIVYITFGHWHAKRRIMKGLPPLRYHRWLLSRQQRARYDPSFRQPVVYYNSYPQGAGYVMEPVPPPPVYDSNSPPPPTYQPPAGGSKIDPSQWRAQPTRRPAEAGEPSPDYEAPPGPPPGAVQADHTGASTTSNNPYRL